MPIRYRIHAEHRAVLARCSDPMDLDQLRSYTHCLGNDSDYQHGYRELIDMRGVRRFDVHAGALAAGPDVQASTAVAVRSHRTAYIADDPLVLAKLEVYRDLGRERTPEVALFLALDSAMAWAGVPHSCKAHFPDVEARN